MTKSDLEVIGSYLGKTWDGKSSILRMQYDNYNQWKQMEWAGFYFQYIIQKNNDNTFIIPGKTFNKTTFDAHWVESDMPLDVKFHSNRSPKSIYNPNIVLNDAEAMRNAIDAFGRVGVLVVCGDNTYDDNGEFKIWHDSLKGEKSKYVKEGEAINRNSRMRKVLTKLTHLHFYLIDDSNINLLGGFQEGMKNSDGSLRRAKYSLNISSFQPQYTVTL
jgi:hypothetical protein